MKKVTLILGMIFVVSCKKNYTCTCTLETTGLGKSQTKVNLYETKNQAYHACKGVEYSVEAEVNGVVVKETNRCVLKEKF